MFLIYSITGSLLYIYPYNSCPLSRRCVSSISSMVKYTKYKYYW